MNGSMWTSLVLFLFVILVSFLYTSYEGFIGDANAARCGVDQPPCPFGTACMNGYCVGTNPPPLPETTGLPVLP